jgi:protein-disulfide isomerase
MMRMFLVIAALIAAPGVAAPAKRAPTRPPAAAHRAAPNWVQTVVATAEGGMRMGNPNAPVKVVEYGSRLCPYCAKFDADGFPVLLKSYIPSGKVSYEFRDYPIHGAIDLGPILLGKCVPAGRFFPLLDLMMSNQKTLIGRDAQVPEADRTRLAKASPNEVATFLATFYGYTDLLAAHGFPAARAKACLADRKALEAIAKRTDDAQRLYGINSTPTFIVNGAVANGVSDWATLEPALQAAGAK